MRTFTSRLYISSSLVQCFFSRTMQRSYTLSIHEINTTHTTIVLEHDTYSQRNWFPSTTNYTTKVVRAAAVGSKHVRVAPHVSPVAFDEHLPCELQGLQKGRKEDRRKKTVGR